LRYCSSQSITTFHNVLFDCMKLDLETLRRSSLNRTSSVKDEVLVPEFMSSEDSDEEGGTATLAVRPLVWRSPKVTKFFRQLDVKTSKYKSTRGKRQTIPRKMGNVSERDKPQAFADNH